MMLPITPNDEIRQLEGERDRWQHDAAYGRFKCDFWQYWIDDAERGGDLDLRLDASERLVKWRIRVLVAENEAKRCSDMIALLQSRLQD